jgi:hypothetical protein
MVVTFNCMMARNNLAIVRLKEIGPKICVEYITLKQSYVIKNINVLVVRVMNGKHDVPGLIPDRIYFIKGGQKVGFRVGDLVGFIYI